MLLKAAALMHVGCGITDDVIVILPFCMVAPSAYVLSTVCCWWKTTNLCNAAYPHSPARYCRAGAGHAVMLASGYRKPWTGHTPGVQAKSMYKQMLGQCFMFLISWILIGRRQGPCHQ
jgi:hypothetical protein